MPRLLIKNCELFTPSQVIPRGWLLAEDGKIQALGWGDAPFLEGEVTEIEGQGLRLLPGYIDLHVHGAMGHETMDADPAGLQEMARFYASHGVTGFLATTWTAKAAALLKVLQVVARLKGPVEGGASILGAHLEGPYLNPVRTGAQDPVLIRPASLEEMQKYFELDVVRLVALAPEIPGNLRLVDECVRRGVTVAAGHTDATYEQMVEAVAHGVTQVTHTYNAMSPLQHRFPGAVGAALAFPELKCELIADNVHVHPGSMKALYQAKGPGGVLLITDAVVGAGMPAGEYPIDDHRTIRIQDGAARLADGSLAGSILTLDLGLRNFKQATGASLGEVWSCSSRNAARQIGLEGKKGSLEPGLDADLVLLDEELQVVKTIVEGKVINI